MKNEAVGVGNDWLCKEYFICVVREGLSEQREKWIEMMGGRDSAAEISSLDRYWDVFCVESSNWVYPVHPSQNEAKPG